MMKMNSRRQKGEKDRIGKDGLILEINRKRIQYKNSIIGKEIRVLIKKRMNHGHRVVSELGEVPRRVVEANAIEMEKIGNHTFLH